MCARRQITAKECVAKDVRVGVGSAAIATAMRVVTSMISVVRKTQQVHTAFSRICTVLHAPDLEVIGIV